MLDQAQLDQFHRGGFLVLRQVFGGDELEFLRLAADRVEADGVAGLGQHHHYHPLPGGPRLYCRSEEIWDRDPIFPATAAHPRLLEAVGQCLGHPFLPTAGSLSCALRFGKIPLPWHQVPPDPGQEHTIPSLEAGICLDQTTVDNGCLWVLPGHHLVGHVELPRCREEELYARARPLEMAAGDLLLLAHSTPRAARGNLSPWTWRIFHIHYLAHEVLEEGCLTGLDLARRMLDLRRSLRLADPESPHLALGEEGFTFTGQPCTPPRYWETLIAQLSPEEIQRQKQLRP